MISSNAVHGPEVFFDERNSIPDESGFSFVKKMKYGNIFGIITRCRKDFY